jgi:anti-sigma factor RsiW
LVEFEPKTEEEQARAITRLVDGSLSASERPAVEAWANERPDIRRQVAAQRRVAGTLSSGGPEAPDRLLAAVRGRVEARDQPKTQRALRGWLGTAPAWRPAAGIAAIAAVCALVVLAVVGVGGANSRPSIPAAANLAFAPSTQPAPAARNSKLLDVSYAGVTYPNYAEFAVPPTGTRTDRIGGRPALTVFYRLPDGTRLSYTVFSGRPVPLPRAAKAVTFDGVPLRTFTTSNGLAVVTLVRFGRTCVLAARTTQDRVLALAAAPVRAEAE